MTDRTEARLHTPRSLADVLERDYFPMPDGKKLYLTEYEWRMVIAALRSAPAAQPSEPVAWRCFWCNAEFTDRTKADIHFGSPHSGRSAPECYRLLQREVRDWLEHADKMAEGIRRAIQYCALDSRSMAADAELIYTARRKAATLPAPTEAETSTKEWK